MKRTIIVAAAIALLGSIAIAVSAKPKPLEERLVDIQLGTLLPEMAGGLRHEPISVKQVMIAYADEPLLVLKAQAALIRYPHLAREIFPLYGYEPEFRAALANYGEHVLLPVSYFLHNEVRSVTAMHAASHGYRSAIHASREWFAERGTVRPEAPVYRELSPIDRGWYAINFINAEGFNFIGQFVVDRAGRPRWVQTERVLEGFASLFGGIRDLERTVQADERVTAAHVGWAALDLAVIVGVTKFATMGKSATVGARAGATGTRTSAAGTRTPSTGPRSTPTWPTTATAARATWRSKYTGFGVVGAIGLLAITNPSLISDALSALARLVGLPDWLVLGVGWALILFPVLLLVAAVARLFVRPIIWVLVALLRFLAPLARRPVGAKATETLTATATPN